MQTAHNRAKKKSVFFNSSSSEQPSCLRERVFHSKAFQHNDNNKDKCIEYQTAFSFMQILWHNGELG
jgi:hypothetical protein